MEVTWWSSESELRKEQRSYLAQASVILARRRPTEKLSPEIGASTCPMQRNNLVAVLAVFVVEFSYGLTVPFMELSVGKPECNSREDLGASREGAQSGLRTCSELGSERYKKQRSERSELGSERYKKQRSERSELGSERYKKPRSERSELGSERYKEPCVASLTGDYVRYSELLIRRNTIEQSLMLGC